MEFKKLFFKMFKNNIRRYYLYTVCGSLATMIFFLFLTLITNSDFNNRYKVNSMISSNIYAPTVILAIFSFSFVIYAHNYFIKFRKKDYGVFRIIGMTEYNVTAIMILENILIASISIFTGLILGTIFSKIFYFLVVKIIDIDINFSVNLKSYLYTVLFFTLTNVIIILKSCVLIVKDKIIDLIKNEKSSDKNFLGDYIFASLGIIMVIASIIIQLLTVHNKKSSSVTIISILFTFIGVYLVIANLDWYVIKILKLFKNKYVNNLIFISNLKYTIGSAKNILFSSTLLVITVIFFSSFSFTCNEMGHRNAIVNNPYDIAYCEVYGKNKLSEDTLNNIIKDSKVELISMKKLEFISKKNVVILSSKMLSETVGFNEKIDDGKYISLFQIDENDGYNYSCNEIESYNIDGTNFSSQKKLIKILFNKVPVIYDSYYLIFNDEDYKKIKSKCNLKEIGTINLMNFSDWRKTGEVENNLNKELQFYNKKNTKQFFNVEDKENFVFRSASKIADFNLAQKSGQFLIFIFCFIFVLFFISANLIVHFKVATEFEREKIKYNKLYKIGITENELAKNILKELRILFMLPCGLGVGIGMYYICLTFLSISIISKYGVQYAILAGAFYIALEAIVYMIYNRAYIKKVL